jgi:hypothetical protein
MIWFLYSSQSILDWLNIFPSLQCQVTLLDSSFSLLLWIQIHTFLIAFMWSTHQCHILEEPKLAYPWLTRPTHFHKCEFLLKSQKSIYFKIVIKNIPFG